MGKIMGVKAVLMTAACLAAGAASATEPLQDRIWYHSRAGTAHHPGKGALALPPSERLRAMAMAESCSAMGGPRGVYRYMSGKLWLVGLHRCAGGIGLPEVYPEMLTPPVAHWISGVVVARLGPRICTSVKGVPIFEAEVTFTIKSGVVQAIVEKVGDAAACAPGTLK
jgi:hypothetical protein